jgi:hypothetical protein
MKPHPRPIFLAIATSAVLLLFVACDKNSRTNESAGTTASTTNAQTPPASTPTNATASVPATNAAAASAIKPAFAKLPGKWQRVDGDYLLQIKNVDSSGKLDAAYFNPKPINVSRALAVERDNGTGVFVELRDVNYPGSTYTLAYDPKSDQLYGEYFQAALQQTFNVTFERVKE